MKYDPKIHSKIHSPDEKPEFPGLYRVRRADGIDIPENWFWCWYEEYWRCGFDDAQSACQVRSLTGIQHKYWFGLKEKP